MSKQPSFTYPCGHRVNDLTKALRAYTALNGWGSPIDCPVCGKCTTVEELLRMWVKELDA